MTETTFWTNTVRLNLSPFGVLHRVENRVEKGTPDVSYCLRRGRLAPAVSGWIELKHDYEWPVRADTKFQFNHYELEQVLWAEGWEKAGGRCCMLAQVAQDYLLVPAYHCRKIFNGVTRGEFLSLATVRGHRMFPTAEVIKWLTRE